MSVTYNLAKNLLVSSLTTALLLLPLVGLAQTSSDAQRLPPAVTRSLQNSTTTVEHAPVTVDVGVRRRISESPAELGEIDLSSQGVINKTRLQMFARHLAMTETIDGMDVGDDTIRIAIRDSAQMLGFIPVSVTYDIEVTFSDSVDDVSINTDTAWWQVAIGTPDHDQLAQAIESRVENTQYISVTQLRAVILEAIIEAINTS